MSLHEILKPIFQEWLRAEEIVISEYSGNISTDTDMERGRNVTKLIETENQIKQLFLNLADDVSHELDPTTWYLSLKDKIDRL